MKAILFLVRKEIKNQLLQLLRHPAKLILYLAVLALLVFSMLSGSKQSTTREYLDYRILHGIYLVVLMFIAVPSILSGLKSGTTFFKMSDVNLLFVSPISPKKILAYGLVKQMASTLLMMFFLLFYGGMMSTAFGITPVQMVILVLGIALMVFAIQTVTLLIYTYSNGRPKRIRKVEITLYAVIVAMVAFIFGKFLLSGSNIEALYAALASPYLEFVPIVGWIKGMIFAALKGNTVNVILYAVLNGIAIAGSILLFMNSESDYYEDVLQTTERTFELKESVKKGHGFAMSKKTQKVKNTGINHGWGANTFFFKHLLQNKRQSPIPFVGVSTLVLLAVNILLVIFLRAISGSDEDQIPTSMLMTIALVASSYILFIFNAAGDWVQELQKPYIYLIPATPFDKLIWASLSTVIKPVVDGVLIFTALSIILSASPATALLCMLVYSSMGFLYIAANILFQRLFGQGISKGIVMLAYMLVILLLLAPGIGISAVLSIFAGWLPELVIGLPVVIWNILISIGVFAACRNLLSTVEFSN
jgi:hypothetical protein